MVLVTKFWDNWVYHCQEKQWWYCTENFLSVTGKARSWRVFHWRLYSLFVFPLFRKGLISSESWICTNFMTFMYHITLVNLWTMSFENCRLFLDFLFFSPQNVLLLLNKIETKKSILLDLLCAHLWGIADLLTILTRLQNECNDTSCPALGSACQWDNYKINIAKIFLCSTQLCLCRPDLLFLILLL